MTDPLDRDRYPNLHRCLVAFPDWDVPIQARRELEALIAEREQAAKREAKAILVELLRKVDGALVDVDALCTEIGIEQPKEAEHAKGY